jgi:RHS repeat-associated protein
LEGKVLDDHSDEQANRSRSTESSRAGAGRSAPQNGNGRDSQGSRDTLKIPVIELPKGGGALKAIDETFQVNSANGTASFSIPLPLSKSRSDFGPALSLGYDSGAGNGVFGLGWGLHFPNIKRRIDKRIPQYNDASESDVFLISGAEDMVPALVLDGVGNWVTDEFTAPTGETVRRYRPRIENSFSRIERITPAGNGSAYWKVTTKENVVTIYGRNTAARIADPSSTGRVFEWLPELSYDDKGNCLEYDYVPEDFQNVPNTAHERNRLNGIQPCANTYLKRVRYGNRVPYLPDSAHPFDAPAPASPEYFFEVVFDYGDHDALAPTSAIQNPWACRLEPFSEHKAGFEIRTYRLCRRILVFHTFKELNDNVTPAPTLVRSLDIDYRYFQNPAAGVGELRNLEVDFPIAMRRSGYRKTGGASYDKRSFPPIQFSYQELNWNRAVQTIDAADFENAPTGLSSGYQFVDLRGEGISGILTEQGRGWFYKSNLGSGRFTPAELVAPKPSFAGVAAGTMTLQDLEADGRKFMVVSRPPLQGYFELSDDGQWQPFTAFRTAANVDQADPDTKFIDLDGDGRADLIVSEENVFRWFPSAGVEGYEAPEAALKPFDEEHGPALVFSDPTGSIFLADMSGDGLTDIVRVRNGEVCYWPNLGYGRFGAKVTMDFAPLFDTTDLFNPSYIHLADVSGTGAADILYLGKNRFRAWINQGGNSYTEETEIDPFPPTEAPNELRVTDLLGNGTACIVWSSPLPAYADSPIRYVDLMGGRKPYLLAGYSNAAGKELTLEYRSSIYFYLQDKLAGRPWVTKLPFPTQCLVKVNSKDAVTRAYLTTEYVYHHGYFDHAEREFRGFGMVEQTDTETFDEFVKSGASNVVNQPLHQAPVLMKTWYDTGAFFQDSDITARFRSEFFQNADFAEHHLPAPPQAAGMSAQERREARRACKGMVIRQETYGLDNVPGVSNVPYSAAERNCMVRMLQPAAGNRYAVFLSKESEAITYSYERTSKDPRISHRLNTVFDQYGNVLESASAGYPRQPGAVGIPAPVRAEQQKLHVTYSVRSFTNDVITNAAYRLRVLAESVTFELTGAAPGAGYFTPDEIRTDFTGAAAIAYEAAPDGSPQKRPLRHTRSLLLKDDLSGPLSLGVMEPLGLPYEPYQLAFTATQLTAVYGTKATTAFLSEGAYVRSNDFKASGLFPLTDANDEWWVHPGQPAYPPGAANLFFMPDRYIDPFGNTTSIHYFSNYQLMVDSVTDPVGNTVSAMEFEFRTLSPATIKDFNDNLSSVRFDILGLVTGTALQGKGAEADDFTGFAADVSPADTANFFSDPVTFGPNLLQHATSRIVYDFSAAPFRAATIVRETHFQTAVASGIPSKLQYHFEYSDGFGNIAMRKMQAEPGIALQLDGSNNVIQVDTTPNLRWVGSGRTVLNNKGKPVKQFEPYFSVTYNSEDDPQLVEIGVSPLLFYDPPGRNIRTEYPNGTFSKTEIEGWVTRTFDQNDTVQDSAWFTARETGALSGIPEEKQAADKTAVHFNTPTVAHADSLGRSVYTILHNRFVDHASHLVTEKFYPAFTVLDIEGNRKSFIDAVGNTVVSYDYDRTGAQAHSNSGDSGERWVLNDCTGKPLYRFDSKNQVFHTLYDAARRPVQTNVQKAAALPIAFDKIAYGEGQLGDKANNLRGRIFEHRDQAGVVTNTTYDFKGNLLEARRVLTTDFQNDIDWSVPQPLQLEVFISQTEYDALNRPVRIVAPNSNSATANVTLPAYNEAGLLDSVSAHLRGAGATTAFVTNIDYNEKGQRQRIDYANASSTIYKYDPDTFRLIGLVTSRNTDPEQFWDDPSKIALPAFASDVLQFLGYTFDPVGNITHINDSAQQTIYFNNRRVEPSCDFTYDAVYWLTDSSGREHIDTGLAPTSDDAGRMGNPQPGDGMQLQTYTLQYDYDDRGNLTLMKNTGNWSMAFTYDAATNHMLTAVPSGAVGSPFIYPYDAHGNVTSMPHLTTMDWDFQDRLRHTAVGAGAGISQESWYVYDSAGQRVRKVVKKGNVTEERYYLGNTEIFRRSRSGTLELERETLHVTDDKRRIAMVDTPTVKPVESAETRLTRYQYSNHLETACLELDDAAQIISYEEYYAYGSTSYQGTDLRREVPAKRYRYTGKERDEETGFYYHGARYYAPWLVRWTAADPIGIKDGLNVYTYCNNNPVILHDPNGTDGTNDQASGDQTEVQVTYETPSENPGGDPVRHGLPPLDSESGTPATTFGNATQSLGSGLQPDDPRALGGALSYYRGIGPGPRHFYPYVDFEANLIASVVGGPGPPAAPLPAGAVTAQISARIAPIPGLPNLTLGGFGNVGPVGASGVPSSTQGGGGFTAQYGFRVAPRWGLGIFTQGSVSAASGTTNYSGTATPILQYQPNDKTQLVLNPTIFAGTGGSFVNQNNYGSFVGGGGLVGVQAWGHAIFEAGSTYTSVSRLPGDTTGPTGEVRVIGGIGYTGSLTGSGGAPVTYSVVANPFIGIPTGATPPASNVVAGGALLTLTVAFRLPLFHQQTTEQPSNNP